MILLDSGEILAAIRRSLEAHVLPVLDDDYGRTQVEAALLALDEVAHRLEHGDPYVAVNARLETDIAKLAERLREGSPAVADQLEAVLADAADIDDPRDRHRLLGDELTEVLAGTDPATSEVRVLLSQHAGQTAAEDVRWMCGAAIQSLQ